MDSVILALIGSFTFALSSIFINRGLRWMDYFTGLLVNLGTNTLLLWLFLAFFAGALDFRNSANLIFVGVGILVPGFARYFMFKGMERLGASISSALVNVAPLFAILFALYFLGELPTPTNLLGALSIVAGVVALSWKGASKNWRTRDLIFPLLGAFLFAGRDNLARYGLLIIHAPIFGAAIAATTSAVTMGLFYLARGSRRGAKVGPRGFLCFMGSGSMNFLSYLCMYTALSRDRVSIVSPLMNSSSLFLIPLAYFLLRDIEEITARKVYATVLILIGVFLISWEKL